MIPIFKKIFFVFILSAVMLVFGGAVRAENWVSTDDFVGFINVLSSNNGISSIEANYIYSYIDENNQNGQIDIDNLATDAGSSTFIPNPGSTDQPEGVEIETFEASNVIGAINAYKFSLTQPQATPPAVPPDSSPNPSTPPSQTATANQPQTPTTPSAPATTDHTQPSGETEFQNQPAKEGVPLKDPLNLGTNPIPIMINRLVTFSVGLVGILALLAFIYGGLLYMTFGYDPKNVEKGKTIMKSAVIGLFITFSSYFVVSFVTTELSALSTKTSVVEVVPPLINLALGISGVLLLIAFIYGGILYMLAGIDPKNVEKAKNIMKYAVMGLAIIFLSYAIVSFLLTSVLNFK